MPPTVPHKYLDTVVHSALLRPRTLGRGYDAAIVCNAANAFVAWLPRVVGTRVVLNVDGLERKRRKWNALGRAWYRHVGTPVDLDARRHRHRRRA